MQKPFSLHLVNAVFANVEDCVRAERKTAGGDLKTI